MTKNAICSVVAQVPLATAYAIWSDFEKYPEFFLRVERLIVNGRQMKWRTLGDADDIIEWEAQLIELTPPRRIAWVTHRDGDPRYVVITLHPLGEQKTEVTLGAQYVLASGGADSIHQKIEAQLQSFKLYAESGLRGHRLADPSADVGMTENAGESKRS